MELVEALSPVHIQLLLEALVDRPTRLEIPIRTLFKLNKDENIVDDLLTLIIINYMKYTTIFICKYKSRPRICSLIAISPSYEYLSINFG